MPKHITIEHPTTWLSVASHTRFEYSDSTGWKAKWAPLVEAYPASILERLSLKTAG